MELLNEISRDKKFVIWYLKLLKCNLKRVERQFDVLPSLTYISSRVENIPFLTHSVVTTKCGIDHVISKTGAAVLLRASIIN